MSYESPIEIIQTQMNTHVEDTIYQSVMKAGVMVDKDELLKALAYDRQQYQKGYKDRDDQIVRCKECKHFHYMKCSYPERGRCDLWHMLHWGEWFCADGERL